MKRMLCCRNSARACQADTTKKMTHGDMIPTLPSGGFSSRIRPVIERIAAVCRRRTMA
ncbi:hypothetical protein [Paraburkholderia haematera]|uniref:hypothetical protein n=1 Tax=Paraburkholderia haematera TaxID=2793077 RepID=UPI001B8C88D4|nr:hypothetical protein [Paraburkholderia haematera]